MLLHLEEPAEGLARNRLRLVGCPIRGDLEIDNCFGCNDLVDLVDEENASYIVCRAYRPALGHDLPVSAGFL